MNHAKKLLGMLAFCLLASAAQDARADLRICNKRASKMWVAHSTHIPRTTSVRLPCGTQRTQDGCFFSAWETAGWKTAEPNQCVTAVVGSFGSRFVYIRAQFADGGVVDGPFNVTVQFQDGFKWIDQHTLHGSSCVVGSGVFSPCTAQPVEARFRELDVGNSSSATINVN